jgi:NTE family protein
LKRVLFRPFLLSFAVGLSACTFVSDKLGVSYQNRPDPQAVFRPTTPVPRASFRPDLSKDSFIGVAISGGGSRAANFGMAVLSELNQLGILQHVDAISAVSGGSIPTAFFALNGARDAWAEDGKKVAGNNFLGAFLGKLINPVNFTATTFTDKDRTDLLAEVMSDKVFGSKNPTFSELGAKGPMRPAVFFNATDTTNGGERFVFSDDRFFERLGSDLDRYPISWAMASSGAFPGIFNSVTLRRFSRDPEVRKLQEGPLSEKSYVHLIDGGSADNLGTDTLTELARAHYVDMLNSGKKQSACMMIVIDSHVPGASILDAKRSDRRNPFAAIIDLNFLDAIDAMLSNRRTTTLQALGIQKELSLGRFNIDMGNGLVEYNVSAYRRVSSFKVRYYEQGGRALKEPRSLPLSESLNLSEARTPEAKHFDCTAWHLALEDIHSIVPWQDRGGQWRPSSLTDREGGALFAYRAHLARVIKQLKTNYKLDGPEYCSNQFLQDALYDAAHIAVREDKPSLDQVCTVMHRAGLETGGRCKATGQALFRADFQVEPIQKPANLNVDEQMANRFVRCLNPADRK